MGPYWQAADFGVGTVNNTHHVGTFSVFLQTLIQQILTRVCYKLGTTLGPRSHAWSTHCPQTAPSAALSVQCHPHQSLLPPSYLKEVLFNW